MEECSKRKAEDELTEVANELVKRNKISISNEAAKSESDAVQIHELSKSRSASPADPNDERASDEAPPEVFADVRLEVLDKNTQIWLESKQNMRFFKEEYGTITMMIRLQNPVCVPMRKQKIQFREAHEGWSSILKFAE